jgi:hypothetical protein
VADEIAIPPELEEEVSALRTLADVLAWGRAHPDKVAARTVIADVVLQDEFTHDAIVPLAGNLTLVFGST